MSGAFFGLFMALAGVSAPGLDEAPAGGRAPLPDETSATPVSREARLDWPGAVQLSMEQGVYELVLRFDRPLDDAEVKRFAAITRPFLADLRWNDDSLVMRPNAGNRIVATPGERSVVVRFVEEDTAANATTPAGDDSGIELALARAQADAAAGYPGEARRRLEDLAQAYPDNKQVQRALADAEAAEGRTADAAARYLSLAADDPMARRIIGESGGRAAAATIYRDGKTFSQWESGVEASVPLASGLMVGGGVRHIRTTVEGVASASGYLPRARGRLTIADLTANLLTDAGIRISLQGSAMLDKDLAGIGARFVIGSPERQARIYGAYRLPDFSTAEQAVFGGHLSRIGVGGTIRITPELTAQADAGIAGYGLPGGGVRTRTTQVLGGLDYLVLRRPLSVQFSYRLDAEYVDWTRSRANGIPFIPLSNRENHTLQVIMSKPIKSAQITAAAGWTKDRYGGSGPTASVGALANLGDAWRLEASGGVSSISRPAISGRQYFVRVSISRALGAR
ncbi:tetratricopeptide repeat protein [Novosphingobium sp. KCTC 2891]|uniref:tetratricopeptide repeat protein n=1 Tax=Novosphingobium sp. KCTC 2891 TaxID=2989730 RepID=UPI0022213283|nr:tetratricopeptide repeat protein [Novosphingobium sp. KCTC 2891]MCW1381899.1 tetratricopeptide repeat protein [Novosphingobium sp. KCTC 2891]